ncbi:hypothetical protein C6496_16185 [Candidatus Poribacteria bacterium]|nr:MAG: hypothetical protein C6496_16185 [Candidatus Poribacteria bacterium]
MSKQIFLSLLNCSWQWMLLCGLTWFVVKRFRCSNTLVYLLWLLSLLGLPILFGLNQFVPAPVIGGDPGSELVQTARVNILGFSALTKNQREVSSPESDTQSGSQLLAGSTSFVNWDKTNLLLCFWAIGMFTLLIRLLFGLYRIYQLRRNAVVADDLYQAICCRLAQRLGIERPVTVYLSDRVVSPISFGWLSPRILIPRKLNLEQFELVVIHELAHVQRLDWVTNLFSYLIGVIFFFHPVYYFLNRELAYLRERICDDWVIRLTGARKNYAQCLLDLVCHRDRATSLALSLNQPSQLASRIDSILKNNRRLDVQLKPRLQLIAATLLLTCLPLLAMAQLVPLKTFQISWFAQTPEKLEEMVGERQKKQDEAEWSEKLIVPVEKNGHAKEHTHRYGKQRQVKITTRMNFRTSEDNQRFSGPQHWEKHLSLQMTDIRNEVDGEMLERIPDVDQKPPNLFWRDGAEIDIAGLVDTSELPFEMNVSQKTDSEARGAQIFNQEFQSCSLKMMLARKEIAMREARENLIKNSK